MARYTTLILLLLFARQLSYSQEALPAATELYMSGEYQGVIEMLQPVFREKRISAEEARLLGMAYQGLQDYAAALEVYSLPGLDGNRSVEGSRAECHEILGATAEARRIYHELFASDTTDIASLVNLARIDYRKRNYVSADTLYQRLVAIYPDNYLFRKNLGIACYNLKKEFDALNHLRRAWELNKRDLELPVNIANVYARFQEPELSLRILAEGLAEDSTEVNILKTAAYINYRLERFDTAASLFGSAFQYGDSSVFTRKHLGLSLFNLNSYEESIPHLRAFFASDTLNSEATYYLGMALCSWRGKEEGIAMLERTIGLMLPDTLFIGSLHAEIGRTWSDINRYDQSLAGYNRALSYAPGNQSYIYEIARLYDRLGKMRNSAAHYRSAIKYFEEYITIEQAILDRVIKERGLDPDQVSSQGLNYARQRIKEINNELFFMGEKQ